MNNEKFSQQTVLWVKRHSDKLMTFSITRPAAYRFAAGQFSRLGFQCNNGFIWRAYSIMSPEYADTLDYFAVLIQNGEMSEYLNKLKTGDTVLLDNNATGFFLPQRFANGKQLVMLSTGSGIAPFLSHIRQPEIRERFEQMVLVHSVSYANDLIFSGSLKNGLADDPLVGEFYQQFQYIPITTRETGNGLHKRIPELLKNKQLENACGFEWTKQDTRFMVCGNPQMVENTLHALKELGYTMHRNRQKGEVIVENGF
ncbi:MAG: ferredoxin--NADP reductase [Neisseriaceae bacterium]|nr:ferredoxin--NADP reductase [Neisseriaceae bacterium]